MPDIITRYVYGIHAISNIINSDEKRIKKIYFKKDATSKNLISLYQKAIDSSLYTEEVSVDKLTLLCETSKHQGVVCELEDTNLSNNSWERHRFILSDYLSLTNDMVFKVTTEDVLYDGDFGSGGSLVEAAFDDFSLQVIDYNYLLGDVNSDSLLNVLDIVLAVNFAVNLQDPSDFEFNATDINNDNTLDVLDIVLLVNLVLEN